MKKNLIFKLGFIVGIFLIILSACSLGTQSYGKLSLSIEIPEYLKTEPNEQPSNARFIHPNGDRLEFKLYTERRVIHTQSIALKSENGSPQTVPISVDKVPYNVPLFAEITVYGPPNPAVPMPDGGYSILGQNTIDIGPLRYPNRTITLGVKPVSDTTVTYKGYQVSQGHDPTDIYLDNPYDILPDTFNIEMFPKKGLYTLCVESYADISLYDSDGKNYPNSFFIDKLESRVRVFYHPEDKASPYYAYLGPEQSNVSGEKLEQDILITRDDDDDDDADVIVDSDSEEKFTINSEGRSFTIYNPYPFTLNLEYTIDNADGEDVNSDSKEKFTFTDFPEVLVLLPGKSKEFTVKFQGSNPIGNTYYSVKSTISAPGVSDFVLLFTGSASGF